MSIQKIAHVTATLLTGVSTAGFAFAAVQSPSLATAATALGSAGSLAAVALAFHAHHLNTMRREAQGAAPAHAEAAGPEQKPGVGAPEKTAPPPAPPSAEGRSAEPPASEVDRKILLPTASLGLIQIATNEEVARFSRQWPLERGYGGWPRHESAAAAAGGAVGARRGAFEAARADALLVRELLARKLYARTPWSVFKEAAAIALLLLALGGLAGWAWKAFA